MDDNPDIEKHGQDDKAANFRIDKDEASNSSIALQLLGNFDASPACEPISALNQRIKHAYGERFFCMWTDYLLACAGSFRSRRNQWWQIVFSNNGVHRGYESVK